MIGEIMTDWSALRHAYGSASDVPGLLASLTPDPKAKVWEEIWSRLCHQGSVYSASFASLPQLLATTEQWAPEQRAQPILLAAGIISSQDVRGCEANALFPFAWVLPRFERACADILVLQGLSKVEFIYLLEAMLTFQAEPLWGHKLSHLASGEFPGKCPRCKRQLSIAIGQYGFFTCIGDWIRNADATRTAIEANEGKLPPIGQRLVKYACAARQEELANWFKYVFAKGICPACQSGFDIPKAIARV